MKELEEQEYEMKDMMVDNQTEEGENDAADLPRVDVHMIQKRYCSFVCLDAQVLQCWHDLHAQTNQNYERNDPEFEVAETNAERLKESKVSLHRS